MCSDRGGFSCIRWLDQPAFLRQGCALASVRQEAIGRQTLALRSFSFSRRLRFFSFSARSMDALGAEEASPLVGAWSWSSKPRNSSWSSAGESDAASSSLPLSEAATWSSVRKSSSRSSPWVCMGGEGKVAGYGRRGGEDCAPSKRAAITQRREAGRCTGPPSTTSAPA